jgi:hypothetical protein
VLLWRSEAGCAVVAERGGLCCCGGVRRAVLLYVPAAREQQHSPTTTCGPTCELFMGRLYVIYGDYYREL